MLENDVCSQGHRVVELKEKLRCVYWAKRGTHMLCSKLEQQLEGGQREIQAIQDISRSNANMIETVHAHMKAHLRDR